MNSGRDISKDSDCILLTLKPFSTPPPPPPPPQWPFFSDRSPPSLPLLDQRRRRRRLRFEAMMYMDCFTAQMLFSGSQASLPTLSNPLSPPPRGLGTREHRVRPLCWIGLETFKFHDSFGLCWASTMPFRIISRGGFSALCPSSSFLQLDPGGLLRRCRHSSAFSLAFQFRVKSSPGVAEPLRGPDH